MALGSNIKRERMIPIRNHIVYHQIQKELEMLKEQENLLAENYNLTEKTDYKQTYWYKPHNEFTEIIDKYLLIAEIAPNGKIIQANKTFYETFCLQSNELESKHLKDFLPQQISWEHCLERIHKEENFQAILELHPHHNTKQEAIICAVTIVPTNIQQGVHYLFIAQNITLPISTYRNNTTIELDIDKNLKSAKIVIKV